MRHFTLDNGTGRKFVILELRGPILRVIQGKPDGSTKRSEKELASVADAEVASERMAGELLSRGFIEQVSVPAMAQVGRAAVAIRAAVADRPVAVAAARRPAMAVARGAEGTGELDLGTLSEAADGDAVEREAILPRLATAAVPAEAAPKPKKKKKAGGKKRKQAADPDGLDKRVIAGVVALALACVGFAGYLGYDTFLKPSSIIGFWEGSRTDHEVSKYLTNTQYRLILDPNKHAAMTLDGKFTSTGTYDVKGNQLKLTFKDEDGEVSETLYRISLGRTTLELYDPTTGKKVVELLRFRDKPAAVALAQAPAAPEGLGDAPAIGGADAMGTSADFLSKDGAFRLKRPVSWEVESGSRPDNTYSWARFTQGSARVQIFADIAGSLMTGSNQSQHEEGSELAPVHAAHELYAKKAAEEYSDFKESAPALFKGSAMGEGRAATFTAAGAGLFGSKLRGIRFTFLTNDRRITVLCDAPASEFDKFKPIFLAIARTLAR